MKKNQLNLLILILLIAGAVVLASYVLKQQPKTNTTTNTTTTNTQQEENIPTPTPHDEVIPFDYTVISVGTGSIKIKGEKGGATLPNSPVVKVHIGPEGNSTEAKFEDIKVGDQLVIKRRLIGKKVQTVDVYIVNRK